MCNEIALRLHIRPGGDELMLDGTAHMIGAEAGGPAALAGAMLDPLDGDGGIFTAAQLAKPPAPIGIRYAPRSPVVSVEQTTNMGGGRDLAAAQRSRRSLAVASAPGLAGAHGRRAADERGGRLAAWRPREYARGFDTAWIDFSKGLGAPGRRGAGRHRRS